MKNKQVYANKVRGAYIVSLLFKSEESLHSITLERVTSKKKAQSALEFYASHYNCDYMPL